MTTPLVLASVYATDEHIAIRCGADFRNLCPDWQSLAYGTDGAFASNAPWVLTSASVNFVTAGVVTGHVLLLTKPTTQFKGAGDLLAVDSVTTGSVTLRRLGKAAGVGMPPVPAAGLAAVEFRVKSFDAQIEDVSFEINRRFGVDANLPLRSPAFIYDQDEANRPRDLRQCTVLTVLQRQYSDGVRDGKGDWAEKLNRITSDLDELLARTTVKWGALGQSEPPTTKFNTRLSR